ncbi:Fanconi-associated nuclease 1 [Perkinsus olseni]|uniref:Fanconi-associated nuclease n=3 Tax=Perkinsus olseni TaxID=32597 RepID=A0A7J6NP20_PEROL|nr:Fanconi-associated nuclease 1 [Perkinsus olseni]
MTDSPVVLLSSDSDTAEADSPPVKGHEAHAAAGEALICACELVMDDLARRERSQPPKGYTSYLHEEEHSLLKAVNGLSLTAVRRLAALVGRKWPKWHTTDGAGDEELFQRGFIYHTRLSPAEHILTFEEPEVLSGFDAIGWKPEVLLQGGGLMTNLLVSLDATALRRLAVALGLPNSGTKASLLNAIRSEFSGRQRTLGRSAGVLDMSTVLAALRQPSYVRLTVVAVRTFAIVTALLEVLGGSPQEYTSSTAAFRLVTIPKSLVLSKAGKFRSAFQHASLSTIPWLLDRGEYELLQAAFYGNHLWELGSRGATELAALGRAIMHFVDVHLDDVTLRLESLEPWQSRLTCWWHLVSVVWHSVWALERAKQWEQAVITLRWLIDKMPSILQNPSRLAKYLHRLRIDLGHLGRQREFKGILAKACMEEIELDDGPSQQLEPIVRIPYPEMSALKGGVPQALDIVVNQYAIADCGPGRSYGRVEAATLRHLGWPGVHDEGGLVRRLMSLLLWRHLIEDAEGRGTVVSPCQLYPGDLYVEGYLDRAVCVRARLEEISRLEPHQLALEVIRASREVEQPPLRFVGLTWVHTSSFPGDQEGAVQQVEPWSPEALAGLAQCMGAGILVRVFTRILSDMRYWGGGMPDLTLWQGQRARFVEVKGPGDDLSARQRGWIAELMRCGADAEVAYIMEPGKKRPRKKKKR